MAFARRRLPNDLPDERVRHLAARIHSLGARPLFELFRELAHGAELHTTLEAYARLAPLASFIRANGGDRLPQLRVAAGTACI